MESTEISLFRRFYESINVCKYYGHAHQIFLLLSLIWKASRLKLNEHYEEFRNIMIDLRLEIQIVSDHLEMLSFPWDFFIFDFEVNSETKLRAFVKFANRVLKNKSWLFCQNHHLDSKILLRNGMIQPNLVKMCTLKFLNKLKQVGVLSCLKNSSASYWKPTTLYTKEFWLI